MNEIIDPWRVSVSEDLKSRLWIGWRFPSNTRTNLGAG